MQISKLDLMRLNDIDITSGDKYLFNQFWQMFTTSSQESGRKHEVSSGFGNLVEFLYSDKKAR